MSDPWINARDMHRPAQYDKVAKIDDTVSKIVGKPVHVSDPRLIALVVKFKQKAGSSADSMNPDDFLKSSDFIEALRTEFK